MKLKAVFLVASAFSFAKPFLIGTTAVGIGLTGSGAPASSFIRYLVFPHIVPAVCFLFLALDEMKYHVFKPLATLVVAGSIAALLASLIPVALNPGKTFFTAGDARRLGTSAIASLLILLIDLFSLIVLVPRGKKSDSLEAGAGDTRGSADIASKEP